MVLRRREVKLLVARSSYVYGKPWAYKCLKFKGLHEPVMPIALDTSFISDCPGMLLDPLPQGCQLGSCDIRLNKYIVTSPVFYFTFSISY